MKFHDCTEQTLRIRFETYGFQCSWCGNRPGRDFHHIQPQHAGKNDEYSNLIWVCEVCHTFLDEFCTKHWNDPEQAQRIAEIRSCSVEATFSVCDGEITKKKGKEAWNFGNVFQFGREGKRQEIVRTAEDIWHDLAEIKKHMKIDMGLCLQYLRQLASHQNRPIYLAPLGPCGDEPVVIAAPSMAVLLEQAKKLQGEREHPQGTQEVAKAEAKKAHDQEDEFFHRVFRPS